jgi:hypothetical protein
MSVTRVLEFFAIKLKEDIQHELVEVMKKKSKNGFSGDTRLGASIRIEYLQKGDEIYGFNLYINDYYYWVNKGRKAGKGVSKEGQEKLAMWVKTRGLIPQIAKRTDKRIKSIKNKKVRQGAKKLSMDKRIKSFVFVISQKIKKKGYEATHFFDKVINDGRVPKLLDYIKEAYQQELDLEIRS